MPNPYPKTPFDEVVTRVAEECFRIAGWMALVAGLIVAGRRLDLPLALVLGYLLSTVLAIYVGVRGSEMMWRAFRHQERGKFGQRVIEVTGPAIAALIWYASFSVANAIADSAVF